MYPKPPIINKLVLFTRLTLFFSVIVGCGSSPKPIPYFNNGQKWDKSIVVLGDWDGNPETPDTYLHWAPVNVGFDSTGEVASKDDHRLGRLYQWGAGDEAANKVAKQRYYNEARPKFWYTELALEAHYTGERWNDGNGPCPSGWRLPTAAEFGCLTLGRNGESGWTTSGQYAGISSYMGAEFFGLNEDLTPGKGVFFPAAGMTHSKYGNAMAIGTQGLYWSAEAMSINNGPVGDYARAQSPALKIGEKESSIVSSRHSCGYSVRCVHDVE